MYGYYDIPFGLEESGVVSLSLEKDGENFIYQSVAAGVRVDKIVLARTGHVLINPIEPMHKPKELTSFLLVEFDKTLLVEPERAKKIFITYPIEIGVFISSGTVVEVLDIFTLARQKFTLYGDPRNGVICKYWSSNVYSSLPAVDPLCEGVIELSITNATKEWVKITKAIFNAYGMKMYYNDARVTMKATMKILHGKLAETDFVDAPVEQGMKKSMELYTAKKLTVTSTKFLMGWGL
ncbi:MAG TPA: DUF432 domain-containing protein [Desulfobacteria bacterium]|nr:DUF432 domain-containing protein [Desulfobacteria bacterium]